MSKELSQEMKNFLDLIEKRLYGYEEETSEEDKQIDKAIQEGKLPKEGDNDISKEYAELFIRYFPEFSKQVVESYQKDESEIKVNSISESVNQILEKLDNMSNKLKTIEERLFGKNN